MVFHIFFVKYYLFVSSLTFVWSPVREAAL